MTYNKSLGLTYPAEDDFYSINVFNGNFSILADAVMNKKSEIVVAASDSEGIGVDYADFVCGENDAGTILNKAINSASSGAHILLLGGTYCINEAVEVNKPVTISGSGIKDTVLYQKDNNGETTTVFNINSENVTIKDMMLKDNAVTTSPQVMIKVNASASIVENVCFHCENKENDGCYALRYGSDSDCGIVRFCRFVISYESANSDGVLYEISVEKSEFEGVALANLAYYNENVRKTVDINFADNSAYENTAVVGQLTKIYVGRKSIGKISNKQEAVV